MIDNDMSDLKQCFHDEMLGLYPKMKKVGHNATRFFPMVSKLGGVTAAIDLVNRPIPSDGFTDLWDKGCLDLTVEALIVDNPEYQVLFNEETLKTAKRRLREAGYPLKT